MQHQKKKSRQRNRPKNKVNRLEEQQSGHKFQQKNFMNEDKTVEAQSGFLSTAQNQLVTQSLYESHETMRLIQQKMRSNYLKQEQSQQQNIHPSIANGSTSSRDNLLFQEERPRITCTITASIQQEEVQRFSRPLDLHPSMDTVEHSSVKGCQPTALSVKIHQKEPLHRQEGMEPYPRPSRLHPGMNLEEHSPVKGCQPTALSAEIEQQQSLEIPQQEEEMERSLRQSGLPPGIDPEKHSSVRCCQPTTLFNQIQQKEPLKRQGEIEPYPRPTTVGLHPGSNSDEHSPVKGCQSTALSIQIEQKQPLERQQEKKNKNIELKMENTTEINSCPQETQISLKESTDPKKIKTNKNLENQNKQTTNEKQTCQPHPDEKHVFIANLQKQMEQVMASGDPDLPQTILSNLQKLLVQAPVTDIESSDEEDEYIEYVYTPRQYFLATLCNFCSIDLCEEGTIKNLLPCKRCQLTYYCSTEHMKSDEKHRQLCYALRQIADSNGGHVFYKCGDFSSEQFRSYRIVTVRKAETIINRPLTPTEQEIILFPRVCCDPHCRENRFNKLVDCEKCGQVAFCRSNAAHFAKSHHRWCEAYRLFKELIIYQARFGRLDPSLPAKILKDLPGACCNTRHILRKLSFEIKNQCEYAALSQISTGPLTAWYALKLCTSLKKSSGILTIHLIGAELEFEVNAIHKWELFFLHITPAIKELNIVFIGPELNPRNISFEQLKKTKCCRACRKSERIINYSFDCHLYHDYCNTSHLIQPDLICFFNAGLYRATGYQLEDTWPQTILAAAQMKCPILVTSYTEYEAPLDMTRFVQECNRHLNVALPPIINPFASEKPERNFVSDDEAPLMFKNYYCFVVE